ncbi:hypothetical protein BJ986_000214 [Phycicoccus badiiscoriae]|uniref:Uncharacterized protein n=1 Tax=Pedococcus badiiscoriae TaxID=642776 RepID=A0A852W939_9MICO|nr:hypothetical protein [Pedococcus badiiscoriae]NYG05727.1 hypothetical protein [Pedococcus badiiscoriae]
MTRHVAIYRTDSPRYRLLRGPLKRWLAEHRIPGLWTPRLRGFQVRSERIPDAVAMLEAEGSRVHLYEREAV